MVNSIWADLWKVDAAAGVYNSGSSGTITSTLNQTLYFKDTLVDAESEYKGYFYISLKHPLAIVPNVRFEYMALALKGDSIEVGARSTFFTKGVSVRSDLVSSSLGMTQYDSILFYSLIDGDAGITFDLGLDVKYLISDYEISSIAVSSKESSIIPLLYLRGRFDTPLTGFGVEGDVKYITDGSSTVYDVRIKVDYTMTFVPVLHPGVELGYRIQQFTSYGDESALIGPILSSDTDSDIYFGGFYAGASVKF